LAGASLLAPRDGVKILRGSQLNSETVLIEIVWPTTYIARIALMGSQPVTAPAKSLDATANLCWMLKRAAHVLTAEITAALDDLGVSPRGHHVLHLAMTGEYTQIELARMAGIDKTTMVVTLDELEAAGLAERRPSREDRRARVIVVTEAGERLVREGQQIIARIHADVLDALPADERQGFVAGLARLLGERLGEPVGFDSPARRRARS
jgi:MarR family transcriptional regulator, transcriptional regulator for hemolysin